MTKKIKAAPIVRRRSDVDQAIEVSQINLRLEELREEARQLKARRETILKRLKRKYTAFRFRDAYSRLFELVLSPQSRMQVDLDTVRAMYEAIEETVPLKRVKWHEVTVTPIAEEF